MKIQNKYETTKNLSFSSAKNILQSARDWDKFYASNIPSSLACRLGFQPDNKFLLLWQHTGH